ncbi:major facilitator superfamily domain-containing protein [Xylaria bambusicola]|uniref:major facilitator superfamily domain-containing protein n=1 Tax=Xylaria bambusicola TaxID=326684 RepID=UPI002008B51C|nr:major facilitator superfamily domain-containing protein [Xylaria bambusicola]KAI0508492.1 major facilitator superfamily domain-containing protein [Xylaria bambusicola]
MPEPEKSGEPSPVIEVPAQQDEVRSVEAQQPQQSQTQEEFKEGGYGWIVVTAVAIINAHSWGLNSSFAVFLAHYIRTNAYQTTAIGYAFIGGLSLSVAFLISPLATFLVGWEKCGTRPTILLGVIFETAAFIGSSFASELWHIILAQGVSFGVGLGLMFVASAPVSSQWFYKKRSYAQGWTAAGSGFGGLVYSLATNAMIENLGLPWTFRTLAIICFVVNGIATFFIRDRNHAVGSVHIAFNWALFKRPSFIMFELWMTFSLIGYIILVFSIVAYCQVVGLSASQASLVGALFNLAQGVGRPAVGLSSDSLGRFNVAQLCTLWCGLLCLFVWMFGARTYAGCIVFALLSGSVAGTIWAAVTPICAEVVGLKMIPSALSITWLFLVLPATFAEVIGLSLRSPGSWGYRNVQLFTAFMYIGAFIFGWILRAWRVWEVERVRLDKEQREITAGEDGVVPSTQLRRHASRASTVKEKVLHLKGLWSVQRV